MCQDSEIYGGRVHRELFPKEIIPGVVRGEEGEKEGKRNRNRYVHTIY